MPSLEVSLPEVPDGVRLALAQSLTQAFTESTGHAAEIFGIRFFEYEPGHAAQGGQLIDRAYTNPYLHMVLYTPRLSRAAKGAVARALTDAFVKATGRSSWKPVIHMCEHPYENVAVNGELLVDTYPELADRPFYYPTGDAAP